MLPGFKGKNGINQTELYQRIKIVLTSKTAFAYMSFIVSVCQRICCSFVIHGAKNPSVVHKEFVQDLLRRFVKNDSFMKQTKVLLKEEIIQIIHIFIFRTLCSFYIFTNTFSILIFEDLFPNSSFHPFVAIMIQTNIFPCQVFRNLSLRSLI